MLGFQSLSFLERAWKDQVSTYYVGWIVGELVLRYVRQLHLLSSDFYIMGKWAKATYLAGATVCLHSS